MPLLPSDYWYIYSLQSKRSQLPFNGHGFGGQDQAEVVHFDAAASKSLQESEEEEVTTYRYVLPPGCSSLEKPHLIIEDECLYVNQYHAVCQYKTDHFAYM